MQAAVRFRSWLRRQLAARSRQPLRKRSQLKQVGGWCTPLAGRRAIVPCLFLPSACDAASVPSVVLQ